MPQVCGVCRLPNRHQAEEALLAGEPLRNVAKRFGTSPAALFRHGKAHLPVKLIKAAESREIDSAESLTAKLKGIEADARRLGHGAERAGDLRTALIAVRELARQYELAARMQAARLQASGGRQDPHFSPEELSKLLGMLYSAAPGDFMWGIRKAAALGRMRGTKLTFEEAFAQLEEEERAVPKETRLLADGEHQPTAFIVVDEASREDL